MITYKDKTFCADEVEIHTCGRELTEEDKKHAEEIGLPIAYGSFCNNNELKQLTTNIMNIEKVNRVEVINYTKLVEWEDKAKVELSLQDDGRTLKIFISNDNYYG